VARIGAVVCRPVPESDGTVKGGRTGVFLDRDGTINVEIEYLRRPEELELIPGAGEAIRLLNDTGTPTCVISNQSGVARGFLTEADLVPIHERMLRELRRDGARINRIYYCPHHPTLGLPPYDIECECRKPQTGMLDRGARDFGLDLRRSFVVGDRMGDVRAALNVGATAILVLTGYGRKALEEITASGTPVHHVAGSIVEATAIILDTMKGRTDS